MRWPSTRPGSSLASSILVVLLAAGITVRRYLLERGGGTVECGLRVAGGSWRLGVAAYQPHELRWYQIFGFLLRPSQVFSRRTLTVLTRRQPTSEEAASLGDGAVVVECRVEQRAVGTVELAMSDAALTGFLRLARGRAAGIPGIVPRPGQLAGVSLSGRSALAAGLPEHVTVRPVGFPREDEQQVRQAVQVLGGQRVHRVAVGLQRRPGAPFRPAHDRPGHVQQGGAWRAAGEDEAAQDRQAALWVSQSSSRAAT